ncbi:histidine phosphatase family protein [Saccharopolyspora sp. K220]|uniref:histidine phosphatase family protein n=1 Tax=Saccharopolyspora soli TaxID=2926618 RepID=UPI001F5ABB65|nr:histidine phosphatase family protein [Saccharopolyspora soli]MCI2421339.1 histidine phosphatase family protein [Saccharopolyspora soli]
MAGLATRYLYLTRHAEPLPGGDGLSALGRRQADLLGRRLRGAPLSALYHGPLSRAAETAQLISEQLGGVKPEESEVVGDYVPHSPGKAELPEECADFLLDFVAQFPPEERERGLTFSREALKRFAGPVEGEEDQHVLLVTHNFLIGWLVRAAQDAPDWRWLGLNHCHAALTVIRYAPGRPSSVLFYNDMSHLPAELRWTGFDPDLSAQLRGIS